MLISSAVAAIREAVDAAGLLMVHDQRLPSVTRLIAGEPVMGSWWSHPLSNVIYNALGELEDEVATCKLIKRKLTLVAPRLWSDLAAIGGSKAAWQLQGLTGAEVTLFDRIEASSSPVLLDRPQLKEAGNRLERRLLAAGKEVHTDSGHHIKALLSWGTWAKDHGIDKPEPAKAEVAMGRFRALVRHWDASSELFPWPQRPA